MDIIWLRAQGFKGFELMWFRFLLGLRVCGFNRDSAAKVAASQWAKVAHACSTFASLGLEGVEGGWGLGFRV